MASPVDPGAGRVAQFVAAFRQTRTRDPRLVGILASVFVGVLLLFVIAGVLLDRPLVIGLLGILPALLAALMVFGQRASRAAIGSIEGQPGAAAAVLQSMRGWRVTPAVAFTRKEEFVHRAVGRPGIVLVGEGGAARVTSLLKQEHRKVARVAGDTPIHEVSVGNGSGQVPLRQLQGHVARLPRALKPDAVKSLDQRLAALDEGLPMPKGPLPRGVRRRM